MKLPADSVIYAVWNLAAIGVAWFVGWASVGFGPVVGLFLLLMVCPLLLLFTVVLAIGDLFRQRKRTQGLLALLLAVPASVVVWLTYRALP
ncbi:MAG: hypothetical protein ABSF46_08580 [Terriglobia bacterium]